MPTALTVLQIVDRAQQAASLALHQAQLDLYTLPMGELVHLEEALECGPHKDLVLTAQVLEMIATLKVERMLALVCDMVDPNTNDLADEIIQYLGNHMDQGIRLQNALEKRGKLVDSLRTALAAITYEYA